jgi:hypothetical protein
VRPFIVIVVVLALLGLLAAFASGGHDAEPNPAFTRGRGEPQPVKAIKGIPE